MTQETKLGLIIGGAFILCFALILSNTAEEQAVEQQIAAMPKSSESGSSLSKQAATGRVPQQLLSYSHPELRTTQQETRSPQPSVRPNLAAGPNGVDNADPPTPPLGQEVIAQADPAVDTYSRQPPLPLLSPHRSTVADAVANRPLTVKSNTADADSNNHFRPATTALAMTTPAIPSGSNWSVSRPRRVLEYMVAAQDNLTKIAKKFYGKGSKHNVERIFQANRSRIKDINSLRIGQTLQIPLPAPPAETARTAETLLALSELNRPQNESNNFGTVATAKAGKGSWIWYQVRPKDRYSKIAKEQLGDEKRWKEIHNLNKNIFPDPDRIRPGVRIRLPKKSLSK